MFRERSAVLNNTRLIEVWQELHQSKWRLLCDRESWNQRLEQQTRPLRASCKAELLRGSVETESGELAFEHQRVHQSHEVQLEGKQAVFLCHQPSIASARSCQPKRRSQETGHQHWKWRQDLRPSCLQVTCGQDWRQHAIDLDNAHQPAGAGQVILKWIAWWFHPKGK